MFEQFVIGLAANAAFHGTKAGLLAAFGYVSRSRPDLKEASDLAVSSGSEAKIAQIFEEAIGVIIAEAGSGSLDLDGATLEAVKGIKFDHQNGNVLIGNTVVSAAVLVTGGTAGSTGQTIVGGKTSLRSNGTSIEIGEGASIVIGGNASIKQT